MVTGLWDEMEDLLVSLPLIVDMKLGEKEFSGLLNKSSNFIDVFLFNFVVSTSTSNILQ